MSPETETGLLFRRTPIPSGVAVVITVGTVLTVLRVLAHTPLPDAPPGDARARVAAVQSGLSATEDGVRVAIPRGWAFARYAHPPQAVERLTVPGLGVVPVGPNRKVIFAALYVLAHKGRWQYTLIAAMGEPPRLCSAEITWIQEHLSLE